MADPEFISREVIAELHGESIRLYDAMIAVAERRFAKSGLAALFRELFSP